MTELNPPLHLQNSAAHTAQGDRLLLRSVWRVGGLAQLNDMTVTAQGSPNMTVNVASGAAIVAGTENALQGMYHCVNDATVVKTISAADTTFARKDIIVAKVQDQAYSGAVNSWSLAVVNGTPASSPVAPTPPVNSIVLATITLPANATTVTNGIIVNANVVARSGMTRWQHTDPADSHKWYNSAGATLMELDPTGHVKSFGTTGGSSKSRKPIARIELNSYSVPNATIHKVLWTFDPNLTLDTDGIWNAANNWLAIQTDGIYTVTASLGFRYTNGVGYRAVGIVRNNGAEIVRHGQDANTVTSLVDTRQVTTTLACSAGDTFYLRAFQSSGAAVTVANASDTGYGNINFLQVVWEAPLS